MKINCSCAKMSRLCYLVVASRRKGRDDAIASRPRHVLTDEEDVFDIDAALNKQGSQGVL